MSFRTNVRRVVEGFARKNLLYHDIFEIPRRFLGGHVGTAYLLTFFSLLAFVKTSEKRREFPLRTIDNRLPVLFICFIVAIQQPCKKGHTVILHSLRRHTTNKATP